MGCQVWLSRYINIRSGGPIYIRSLEESHQAPRGQAHHHLCLPPSVKWTHRTFPLHSESRADGVWRALLLDVTVAVSAVGSTGSVERRPFGGKASLRVGPAITRSTSFCLMPVGAQGSVRPGLSCTGGVIQAPCLGLESPSVTFPAPCIGNVSICFPAAWSPPITIGTAPMMARTL